MNITEGPRTYIERIDIIGNTRTLDEVIRRELRLYEGDAYNRVLVERGRRRLTSLDFFEKIDMREEPGSAPDRVVLIVEVVEKSTGSLNLTAGYSTTQFQIDVPSFGNWGFVLATPGDGTSPALRLASDAPRLRYLDEAVLKAASVFPVDRRRQDVQPSTLMDPAVLEYVLDEWENY